MKRRVSIGLAVVLLLAVVGVIIWGNDSKQDLTTVRGVIGSEKQPFFTDNSDVALYHRFHSESNNEFDVLPSANIPNLRQDTQTVKFSVGAFRNCEIGMDFPFFPSSPCPSVSSVVYAFF